MRCDGSTPPDEQTALVVLVPEAEPLVAGLRSRFDRSAIRGMPAHVTVLYPFRDPGALTADLEAELGRRFARIASFRFDLVGICGFPGVVYLAPEPSAPFDRLTRDVASWFPEHPPYGGLVPDPKPHLTVAQAPPAPSLEAVVDELLARVGACLPIESVAREVTLAVKRAGRWSLDARFPLEPL